MKEKLRTKLKGETGLKEVDTDGDVHFDCTIVSYKVDFIPGNEKAKVSMTIRANYRNKFDAERQFKDKNFSKDIDVAKDNARNDAKNMDKILDAVLLEIFSQSVNAWD